MKLFKILSIALLFLTVTLASAQSKETSDCKILKKISLKYTSGKDKTAFVIIKNKKHVEYFQNKKYFIKSDLTWLSDCEYNAKITAITLPNFPYKPGDVMNVKFERIDKGVVSGIATIHGTSFPVQFEII